MRMTFLVLISFDDELILVYPPQRFDLSQVTAEHVQS